MILIATELRKEWECINGLHDIRIGRQHEYCMENGGARSEYCDRFCVICFKERRGNFQVFNGE